MSTTTGSAPAWKSSAHAPARRSRPTGARTSAPIELYRELVDDFGETEFTGRHEYETTDAKVLALVAGGERLAQAGEGEKVDVVLDRTPFYAEAGGQVGDTGTLATGDGRTQLRVLDTQYGIPGSIVLHRAEVVRGELAEGDSVTATIDAERRDRIRRNHTATHVLHWALREVLGPHVKQAGSLVAPDRLRFDFSHFQAVTPEELDRVEALANREIITDAPVRHYETTREHAEAIGAIAFFGEKYGDLVRVLEAGNHSVELCGGTHVHALGFIGPIKIVGEQSIGANLRRIEAVTGDAAIDRIHDEERQLRRAAETLKVAPAELPDRIEQLQQQLKTLKDQVEAARAREAVSEAAALAADAADGVVAARRDGLDPGDLRRLALATRDAARLRRRRARRRGAGSEEGRPRGRGLERPGRSGSLGRRRSRPRPPRRSAGARPRTPRSSWAAVPTSTRSTRPSPSYAGKPPRPSAAPPSDG